MKLKYQGVLFAILFVQFFHCVPDLDNPLDPNNPDKLPLDITPPSISVISHFPGQNVSTAQLTIRVNSSDANGVSFVLIDGDTANLKKGDYKGLATLSPGTNLIEIIAEDNSSNRNRDTLQFPLVLISDTTPPSITPISHTPGDTVSESIVLVQVSASDASEISFVLIGGDTAVFNGSEFQDSVSLSLGQNAIEVIAEDNSDNQNRDTLNIPLEYIPN